MQLLIKIGLVILSLSGFCNIALASDRVVLNKSSAVEMTEDEENEEEVEDILIEQSILEGILLRKPGIIVTPYYDEFGRVGAKVIPSDGEPYYVDPHYDDPMQTNRHSDEANTDSNWRVFTWGD